MQFDQDKDTFIIYLEKDDRIMESLTDFCKDQNIDNGKISGIGAIKDIELGAYDLSNKTVSYTHLTLPTTPYV